MDTIVNDRVAFFLPALTGGGGGPGGAERITLNLASEVASRGFRPDLVLPSSTPGDVSLVPDGVRLVNLGTPRVSRSLLALSQYLKRERPRALLSALDHGNVIALWARRLSRMPIRVVV